MADDQPSKFCPKCESVKPVSEFWKNRKRNDGLCSWCKDCTRTSNGSWERRNRPRRNALRAKRHSENPEINRSGKRRRYWANPEKFRRERVERYWSDPERFREEAARAGREKRAVQRASGIPVQLTPRQLLVLNRAQKKYRLKNPEKVRIWDTKKRSKRSGAIGEHTRADIARILKQQKGKCAYCPARIAKSYTVDHIVALARGGTNHPNNIQFAL